MLLVGGRQNWICPDPRRPLSELSQDASPSDWFLHISSCIERTRIVYVTQRTVNKKKWGGKVLEGRKCKEREVKITIWGESSQTDRWREIFRARGDRKKPSSDKYNQFAYKFPNRIYKKVINELSKLKLSHSHHHNSNVFLFFPCILIQMLMSARQAAAPGTSLLLLSIRINHERWAVVELLQTDWQGTDWSTRLTFSGDTPQWAAGGLWKWQRIV